MDRSTRVVLALCGRRRAGKDTVAAFLSAPRPDRTPPIAHPRLHQLQQVQQLQQLHRLHHLHTPFEHVKISGALKRCVAQLFDLSHEDVEGSQKDAVHPVWGIEPRRIMQWFGTDVMQHHLGAELLPAVGRTFWVARTAREVRRIVGGGGNVVISDVRFPHELDALQAEFEGSSVAFITVFIERGLGDGVGQRDADADVAPADAHESESGVDLLRARASVVVTNDGTREELCRRVSDAIDKLG